jgi:hypothetical protein
MIRYQWSNKFKDEIIVVETTDGKWEDFVLEIDKARTTFNTPKAENISEAFPNDEPQSKLIDESFCTIHQVKMKERVGRNGKFFSHSQGVYPDLIWCSGSGFKEK